MSGLTKVPAPRFGMDQHIHGVDYMSQVDTSGLMRHIMEHMGRKVQRYLDGDTLHAAEFKRELAKEGRYMRLRLTVEVMEYPPTPRPAEEGERT